MKNTTTDLTAFKNRIFFYGILVALIFEAGSLLFLGFDVDFAYGLAMGTAVSVVNFNILVFTSQRVLRKGRARTAFISYIVRLAVYGFVFYMALRVDRLAALGAVFGFVTLKVSTYWLHGFRAKPSKARNPRPRPRSIPRPEPKPEMTLRKRLKREIFDWPDDADDWSNDADGAAGADPKPRARTVRRNAGGAALKKRIYGFRKREG